MQSAVQKRFSSQDRIWPGIPSKSQKIRENLTEKEIQRKEAHVEKTLLKGFDEFTYVQQMSSHFKKIIALLRTKSEKPNENGAKLNSK